MKTTQLLLAFGLLAAANALCPNSCSGNGKCGQFDKCECHQNWQGPDCSLRTCPFELAWVDVGTDDNDAHYYAECANKGTCDRKSGECKCFDGYEGKGCRRSTCPNECSGHGTCEYIDELIEDHENKRTKDFYNQASASITPSDLSTTGNTYDLWDAQKVQGCSCDANWEGPDCSARTCPRGDDPLTTQINGNYYSTYVDRQAIHMGDGTDDPVQNDEFSITYYDLYGGKWVTSEIVVGADSAATAVNVQAALRALPNRVMDGVQVYAQGDYGDSGASETNFGAEVKYLTRDWLTYVEDASTDCVANQFCFVVEFADMPGTSGLQYLLEVNLMASTTAGYQPYSEGVTAAAATSTTYHVASAKSGTTNLVNQNYNNGNTQEAAYCSNRGLCDSSTGDCECFSGYRGLACQEQEALT
jgi:hypothetical protein